MAGETHGYDLAMEIGVPALQDLVATFFSDHDIPCALVQSYLALLPLGTPGTALGACYPFTVTASLSRPTGLPPSATNPIDITIQTGNATSGTTTRIVVGLDVDHSQPSLDFVRLNITDKLYLATVTLRIGGVSTPLPGNAASVIRGRIPSLALVPVPVTRGSTDCKLITALDAFVLDDLTGANRDALVIPMTAGGGMAGDPTAFTNSIPATSDGALLLAFSWICRCLTERLTSELNLPAGSMQDCRLQQRVRIDQAREVDLTELTISLEPPHSLALHARVHKEGFCYEANGTVNARITLGIENGNLHLTPHVDPPDVDIDVPWYCWLAAVVIALVTGGLVGWLVDVIVGIVIGVVVGGILVFLLWLLDQVVAGTVAGVTDSIKQALNSAGTGIDVPLLNMDLVLDDITIDDVAIGFQVIPISTFPIRSEGVLELAPGQAVDLDNGSIGPPALIGGDLLWNGSGQNRRLSTICTARLARTGRTRFDDFSRYQLSVLAYSAPATVPYHELATHVLFWDVPSLAVFGVRTDEGRLAAVQVVGVSPDRIRLRYRTYQERVPSVRIDGAFGCEYGGIGPAIDSVELVPLEATQTALTASAGSPAPETLAATARFARAATLEQLRPANAIGAGAGGVEDIREARPTVVRPGAIEIPEFGQFVDTGTRVRGSRYACFAAVPSLLAAPLQYEWILNGRRLDGDTGTVGVDGGTIDYRGAATGTVCLTVHTNLQQLQFQLEVTVTDSNERVARTARCISWTAYCTVTKPPAIAWKRFKQAFDQHWGVQVVRAAAKGT